MTELEKTQDVIEKTQHIVPRGLQMHGKDSQNDSEKFLTGLLRISKIEENRSLNLSVRRVLNDIPHESKYTLPKPNEELLSSEKALLTRKANELYRLGQIQTAEKIYLTVGYSAGLYQLAKYYLQKNNFLRAYLLFKAADNDENAELLIERFIAVIRKWIKL